MCLCVCVCVTQAVYTNCFFILLSVMPSELLSSVEVNSNNRTYQMMIVSDEMKCVSHENGNGIVIERMKYELVNRAKQSGLYRYE